MAKMNNANSRLGLQINWLCIILQLSVTLELPLTPITYIITSHKSNKRYSFLGCVSSRSVSLSYFK